MTDTVYTIGHSNHADDRFIALLQLHGVTAVADVRSRPYSRLHPQFNREMLRRSLAHHGIAYAFLGAELGARPDDPGCYAEGKVRFDRLGASDLFQAGLDRVERGTATFRVAMMCAEKDPITCHRTVLVARHLVARGLTPQHILDDGTIESHEAATNRLLAKHGWLQDDLFRTRDEAVADAYIRQGEAIAYADPEFDEQRRLP